jgi:hypothetical protein
MLLTRVSKPRWVRLGLEHLSERIGCNPANALFCRGLFVKPGHFGRESTWSFNGGVVRA